MLFTTLLLAGLVSAAPALNARKITNKADPWDITAANGHRPSGRPGNSPYSTLEVNIKQPNNILLQKTPEGYSGLPPFEASCTWSWIGASDFPVGIETLCATVDVEAVGGNNNTYGNFTMTLSGTSQADFAVAIKETREVNIFEQTYVRVFKGEQAFSLNGDWRQICGGSGACSWQFRDGALPLDVEQELTESIGSCEEATTGGC